MMGMRGSACLWALLVLAQSCVGLVVSSSAIQNQVWIESGSSLKSVKKISSDGNIRVQVELALSPGTDVDWIVDRTLIRANEQAFGTSTTKQDASTLFTIDMSNPVKHLELKSSSNDDVQTRYIINTEAADTTQNFDIGTCQTSIVKIDRTTFDALFRCSPDLNAGNSWYQNMSIIHKGDNDRLEYGELRTDPNPYLNVSFERSTTAKGTAVFSDFVLNIGKTFLFLGSSLTLKLQDVVESIQYRYLQDISPIKTEDEFVLARNDPDDEILEGKTVTIFCEAFGRNPPPVRMTKNGEEIRGGDGVDTASVRDTLWSSYYVTYLHATKKIAGNYTCVAGNVGREAARSYIVEIKPVVIWDRMLGYNPLDERRVVVVKGSKGVSVTCMTPDHDGVILESVKRTPLNQWTEEFEARVPVSAFSSSRVDCTAADKNGIKPFQLY